MRSKGAREHLQYFCPWCMGYQGISFMVITSRCSNVPERPPGLNDTSIPYWSQSDIQLLSVVAFLWGHFPSLLVSENEFQRHKYHGCTMGLPWVCHGFYHGFLASLQDFAGKHLGFLQIFPLIKNPSLSPSDLAGALPGTAGHRQPAACSGEPLGVG